MTGKTVNCTNAAKCSTCKYKCFAFINGFNLAVKCLEQDLNRYAEIQFEMGKEKAIEGDSFNAYGHFEKGKILAEFRQYLQLTDEMEFLKKERKDAPKKEYWYFKKAYIKRNNNRLKKQAAKGNESRD